MNPPRHHPIPEEILQQTRLSSAPLYLRTLFSRLPEGFAIELEVPADTPGPLPLVASQLLKLGILCDRLSFRMRTVADTQEQRLHIWRGQTCFTPSRQDFDRGISHVVRAFLESLFTRAELSELTERLAFQTSTLATLRALTSFMLESNDVDQALYIMLSGLTSGYALGFNRAILFDFDEESQSFIGTKAIGPIDAAEAHRIWEAVELEDKSLDDLITDIEHRNFDTRFQQTIQNLSFPKETCPRLHARLLQTRGALVLKKEELAELVDRPLDVADESIIALLRPHGTLLGAVFADNRYNGVPIGQDQRDYFGLFIDQTALAWENLALLKRVEALAREDVLTGVLSRRELELRMGVEFSRCRRHGRPCSLMVIDIDLFKQVNDTQGHAAGDEILRTLGALLARELRIDDVVGRFGGDEFVVVMPEIGETQALRAAQRIGETARASGISLSIGGASWPQHVERPEDLFECADRHLYEVKRKGRAGAAFSKVSILKFGETNRL